MHGYKSMKSIYIHTDEVQPLYYYWLHFYSTQMYTKTGAHYYFSFIILRHNKYLSEITHKIAFNLTLWGRIAEFFVKSITQPYPLPCLPRSYHFKRHQCKFFR